MRRHMPALILVFMLLITTVGCVRFSLGIDGEHSGVTGNQFSSQPAETEPAAPPKSSESARSNEPAKEANWVIEIDDTQEVYDAEGIKWYYKLTMYASKAGGEDVFGNYTGDMVLQIEPDYNSVVEYGKKEGAEVLAWYVKSHTKAQNLSFELMEFNKEQYSEMMSENAPDSPVMPIADLIDSIDAFALDTTEFQVTTEPFSGTVRDENGVASGGYPGSQSTVYAPFEIKINAASAYLFLYGTPHPLLRTFKGIITGDVIN